MKRIVAGFVASFLVLVIASQYSSAQTCGCSDGPGKSFRGEGAPMMSPMRRHGEGMMRRGHHLWKALMSLGLDDKQKEAVKETGGTDEGLAQRLALLFRRRGMNVVTGAQVEEIACAGGGLAVTYRDAKGVQSRVEGDRVLVAVGRWPNTEGLGLAEVGVKMTGRAIAVDEHLATSVPERVGRRRRGRRSDAGAQGHGRRARGGRERLRRQSQRGLPIGPERRLHAPRGRQRRPDRGAGATAGSGRQGRAVPVLGQSASADPRRDGWPGEARVRRRERCGAGRSSHGAARRPT